MLPHQLQLQLPVCPPLLLEELDELELLDELLELELLEELDELLDDEPPPQAPLKQSSVLPKPITPLQCMVSE